MHRTYLQFGGLVALILRLDVMGKPVWGRIRPDKSMKPRPTAFTEGRRLYLKPGTSPTRIARKQAAASAVFA